MSNTFSRSEPRRSHHPWRSVSTRIAAVLIAPVLVASGACGAVGCATTTEATLPPPARRPPTAIPDRLMHTPLDPTAVVVTKEPITVEDAWVLDLYTWLHSRDYLTLRVDLGIEPRIRRELADAPPARAAGDASEPDSSETTQPSTSNEDRASDARRPRPRSDEGVAHLLVPPGDGPHPTVIVYPILAGSHVASEAFAKALVRRGLLVARLERAPLMVEEAESAEAVAETLRASLLHGRRLLDYLETRPDVDRERIAAAGISLGGVLACLLHGVDARVHAGAYIMTGGDVAAIMSDSSEVPVRLFREKIMARDGLADAAAFADYMRTALAEVDPLTYASRIDPATVWMMTARFDRVIRPPHADALRRALGEPTWVRVPVGHYQLLPYFWWGSARVADHLHATFGTDATDPSAEVTSTAGQAAHSRRPDR